MTSILHLSDREAINVDMVFRVKILDQENGHYLACVEFIGASMRSYHSKTDPEEFKKILEWFDLKVTR